MLVANHLFTIRQTRGISVADLAGKVGVKRQTIYAIESGNYVPNTVVTLRLARALEVAVEDIFGLADEAETRPASVSATLLSDSAFAGGPVRLAKVQDRWVCAPVDQVPYYLAESDGVGLARRRDSGDTRVQLADADDSIGKRLVIAGCDPAIGMLARMTERLTGIEVLTVPASSRNAIEWLKEGKVHIAGSHLEDPATGEFNLPHLRRLMPGEDVTVVTFARWEEGFVVAKGNPLGIKSPSDLARPGLRMVNRESGSGSRALLDSFLRDQELKPEQIPGYSSIVPGHLAAGRAVSSGLADFCIAVPSAARAFGLDFVPLKAERFDFAVKRATAANPAVRAFLDLLQRSSLRRKLESLAGYDTSQTGSLQSM